jgi:sugar lactone lactonase YvrE
MPVEASLLADGFMFLEAPRWHRDRLYVSDFYTHLVHAFTPDGRSTVICEVPGQPSGLGFAPAGELLVVSMTDRRLLRLEGDDLVEVADLSELAPGWLNDMVVDPSGRAFVGNIGTAPTTPTVLIRVDPDGSAVVAADGLVFPNGCAFGPGGTLLVAETFGFRVTAFDLGSDGTLSGRRTWASFAPEPAADWDEVTASDAIAPDGIAIDSEGALWVPNPKASGLIRVAEGGEVLERIETGDLAAYAVAFGGADGRDLYVCAGPPLGAGDPETERRGALLACRVEVPGAGAAR